MSDWRYWITYAGVVEYEPTEDAAIRAAQEEVYRAVHGDVLRPVPTIEVEEVGEGE